MPEADPAPGEAEVMTVRAAAPEDVQAVQEIEVRAGARFREVGMHDIAEHPPPTAQQLLGHIDAGWAWVASTEGQVIGYVVVAVVDEAAHIEQISVDPDHQGRGTGRQLLGAVADAARARSRSTLTLTTFREVPWNAPWYERLGFRVLAEHEIGTELRAVRAAEAEQGLDPEHRVCMALDLPNEETETETTT